VELASQEADEERPLLEDQPISADDTRKSTNSNEDVAPPALDSTDEDPHTASSEEDDVSAGRAGLGVHSPHSASLFLKRVVRTQVAIE
jgi:hypothetical protein